MNEKIEQEQITNARKHVGILATKIDTLVQCHLKDLPFDRVDKWLIVGRAINTIFSSFYNMSICEAESVLEKQESEK